MTTYTAQQIADAHLVGIKAGNLSGYEVGGIAWVAAYRDAYTEALGLTVEDPTPEPGIYLCDEGHIGFVDYDGDFHILNLTGGLFRAPTLQRDMAAYGARPARVVPAEPVELTEEQVAELWDEHSTSMSGTWLDLSPSERQEQIDFANAALAKYGGTR